MLSQVRIIALISILSLGLFSCAAYKIGNAVKYKVKSGVSTGTPVFRYEITIKVKKATSFQKIEMDSLTSVSTFSVTNVYTNKQSNNSKEYKKGTYLLSFDTPINDKNKELENPIRVYFTQGEKKVVEALELVLIEDKQLR